MPSIEEDISNAKAEIAEIRAIVKDIALAQLQYEGELRKQSEINRDFKEFVFNSQQNFEARWAKLDLEREEERALRERDRLEREEERKRDQVEKEKERALKEKERIEREEERKREQIEKEKERLQREIEIQKANAWLEKERLESEKYRQRWNEERREMNKKWGELANKMGTLVEDIVAPNIPRIAKEHFNVQEVVDFSVRRIVKHPKDASRIKDFDALLIGKDTIILNETKSTVRLSYIDEFIAFIPTFFEYLPQYQGKKIIPIFSSLYIPENFLTYLTKNKIYALAMGDDSMELMNLKELSNLNNEKK